VNGAGELTIDFTSGGNSGDFVLTGWGGAERQGTWSVGGESRLRLTGLTNKASYIAKLSVLPYVCAPPITNQRLTVKIGDQAVFEGDIESAQIIEFAIPSIEQAPRPVEIVFLCPTSVSPYELGRSSDHRRLGILVRTMTLAEHKGVQTRGLGSEASALRGTKLPSDTSVRLERLVDRGLRLKVGRYSYGEPNVQFNDKDPKACLSIGNFCSIATGCTIFVGGFGRHHVDFISTFPLGMVFRKPKKRDVSQAEMGYLGVSIGSDVWIGRNATIMAGVTIGHGAVVGAASVVSKNVPPYGIVAGAPAKIIRYRFEDRQIERLLAIRWWDWDDERIEGALELFYRRDIDAVLDLIELEERGG
jgi:chloramphenicol O-acetyltransferase type B